MTMQIYFDKMFLRIGGLFTRQRLNETLRETRTRSYTRYITSVPALSSALVMALFAMDDAHDSMSRRLMAT